MAASSEIRFKIGADTSALSKAFVGAQSVAAAAGARLQKTFGLKDAMKGIFQGIGIGSVAREMQFTGTRLTRSTSGGRCRPLTRATGSPQPKS